MEAPNGKYAWIVKLGEKGQFVIPKEARELFGYRPGDELLVLAHFPQSLFTAFLQQLRAMSLSIPLKCVLTEQNRGWNLLELHAHLCEERDAAKRGETAHEAPAEGQNAE